MFMDCYKDLIKNMMKQSSVTGMHSNGIRLVIRLIETGWILCIIFSFHFAKHMYNFILLFYFIFFVGGWGYLCTYLYCAMFHFSDMEFSPG